MIASLRVISLLSDKTKKSQMNYWNEQTVYLAVNIASVLLCLAMGILLVDMRSYLRSIRRVPVYPQRYIAARRALGIAYLLLGGLMALKLTFALPEKQGEFLPVSALVISTSQALLFTAALLSLYNSPLVRRDIIWWNVIPIVAFPLLYVVFSRAATEQMIIRYLFFAYYVLQLILYTALFFRERRRYLDTIEDYFDQGKSYRFYSKRGVALLFLCSLAIGVAALASYFFTELWQITVFIATYTIYYVWVACYFLDYAIDSQKIHHVTTPEEWKRTEQYLQKL